MENIIKVGLGGIIKDGNKILLGHRCDNYKDTGSKKFLDEYLKQ